MSRLSFLAIAALALLVGCNDNPVTDSLSLWTSDAGAGVAISTLCADPSCAALEQLHVQLAYADHLAHTERVDFEQYRVDYQLEGVAGTVPYYAGLRHFTLIPGESLSLDLEIAGGAQRAFVIKTAGHRTLSGTAELTLAGYDHDNAQVFVKTQFKISFGEFDLQAMGATPTDMTQKAGTQDAGAH